jgi:hypothetical protein
MFDLAALSDEFPRSSISWRAQTVTKTGDKALALAYIDARDVMDRLDTVCGPANWQDRYEFHGSRTICYLSIRIGDEWVTKADGAGDSDVEAEKGAISDALKRAAVKWGIGRYLYALESPWVPCETYEAGGKKHWKRWTADPWSCVRGASAPLAPLQGEVIPPEPKARLAHADPATAKVFSRLQDDMREAAGESLKRLGEVWKASQPDIKRLPEKLEMDLIDLKEALKQAALVQA